MDAFAPGIVIAGKYRLERPLAHGGMGSVWVAFDTRLEVPVAVKFMAPALAGSTEFVGQFEREAKSAAQLRSPHVVQVFEHGVDGGTPYMVMELLEGEDLGKRLRRQGRISLWEAAVILEQACKALRKAHEAGIVHRDLKPGNIFLARHDEDEVVKVLDFGIAKSADPAQRSDGTRTGVVMGSPSYMSPEQVRSSRGVDHRSDLWSLGLVMFRAVTGRMAFVGETDADTMIRLCSDPIPVPSAVVADLPPEVDAWFARALVRDPEGRFQSAREMGAAFGRIVGRVPSLQSLQDPVVAMLAPAPVPRTQAVELTASDLASTAQLARVAAGAQEKTMPLPDPAVGEAAATAPLPVAALSGATLTNAGNVTAPAQARTRGGLAWGVGVVVALGAIGTVAALATRSMPLGVAASAVPAPTESVSAAPVEAVTVEPSARARAAETAARGPSAHAPSASTAEPPAALSSTASVAVTAPKSEPQRTGGKGVPAAAPSAATSEPAPSAPGGLLEIPRVLDNKRH